MDKTSKGRAGRRPNFPAEFKRRLVEQTFEPGASVALISRRNDINANLLFRWRRQYHEGAYGVPALAGQGTALDDPAPLLPVRGGPV